MSWIKKLFSLGADKHEVLSQNESAGKKNSLNALALALSNVNSENTNVNTAVGYERLGSLMTGNDNVAIGGGNLIRTCPECKLSYWGLHPNTECKHGIIERVHDT